MREEYFGWSAPKYCRWTSFTSTSDCRCFYGKLDILMDETVLVGRGKLCQAELRPLAFSMLAELVHHVRQQLTIAQLSRVVYLFSRSALLPREKRQKLGFRVYLPETLSLTDTKKPSD